ncbi:MAG TPA: aminoacyl-histidine dipeptidase [Thermoanaerobaculia bacterium]|nr:aminoacyl-histidine dipeptidase [Thermoanaerobaculia bacterium]
MSFVSELEPQSLWKHFDEILSIPRPSKHEEGMRRYVLGLAERKGYRWREDSVGNLVIEKPASPGKEGAPIVVLQSHLDMVTEKNSDVTFDFARDPIAPRRDGEYVKASGTTLGADNGIGVAAMLAVLEADDLVHGPLELLFTVDEETGLTGVGALEPDAIALKGRILLNLDSEEEGAVTIGCAGGSTSRLLVPIETGPPPAGTTLAGIGLSGLLGGHSGMEIHLQRGNAVKLLARALFAAFQKVPFRLVSFQGGNKHNALPREAEAFLLVESGRVEELSRALDAEVQAIACEYPGEPLTVRDALAVGSSSTDPVWTEETSRKVLDLLNALPHGVLAMSRDIPGLVETSTNLAAVSQQDGALSILISNRSSVNSAMKATRRRLHAFASLAGARIEENEGYPGWKPNLESPVLNRFREVHRRVLGQDPELRAIHAGLECGVIGEKFSGMDMISFGPEILGAHSPDERVKVDTVGRFYGLLGEVLKELAG